jgi:hypothetical protein
MSLEVGSPDRTIRTVALGAAALLRPLAATNGGTLRRNRFLG